MTEPLHFDFSLSCIGEGNGNPLQCSCLESPRDGGAWWAAVCGVTQSRTQQQLPPYSLPPHSSPKNTFLTKIKKKNVILLSAFSFLPPGYMLSHSQEGL